MHPPPSFACSAPQLALSHAQVAAAAAASPAAAAVPTSVRTSCARTAGVKPRSSAAGAASGECASARSVRSFSSASAAAR